MSGLPAGALDALLSPEGGTEAFDKVIADSQAQTQAILAKNNYSAQQIAKNTPTADETRVVREGYVLRGMREHGLSRAEAEKRFDQEVKDERAKRGLDKPVPQGVVVPQPEGTFDTSQMSDEDVIRLAGIEPPRMPSQFEYDQGALASFGDFALREGVPSRLANEIVTWWGDIVVSAAGGDVDPAAVEQNFNENFPELSAQQRQTLVSWMKSIHGWDA